MGQRVRQRRARQNAPLSNIANPSLGLVPADDPLDELAHSIDGTFVLVVRLTGGRYRRRCFLTVASAERAARNALNAGYNVEIYLSELKALYRLAGRAVAS